MSCPALPVVVFQMGKVGSSSVVASLERSGLSPVYQVHVLNPHFSPWITESQPTIPHQPSHMSMSRTVYQRIILPQARARFITLVREPIGRNISAFFQNLEQLTGRPFAESAFSLEELARVFADKLDHRWPLVFFDREVKAVLGIDVFAHPFPQAEEFLSISQGPHELLVLKCESADARKEEAVARFLGLASFKIERTNVGARKHYAPLYRRFAESVRLPHAYLEGMLSSRYATHFYTHREIESFRARWSDPRRNLPALATVAEPQTVA